MTKPVVAFFDLHTNKYNQFSEHHDRLQDCLNVINDVFKLANKINADTILFGGDLGDLPKWIYIAVLTALTRIFRKWFTKYPHIKLYAISGNHDQNTKNYWDKPADTLLSVFADAFPDNFILIDNKLADLGNDCFVAGIPYYEHKACFDKALDEMSECCKFPNYPEAKVTLLIHQTPEGIYNPHIKAETSPADPRYQVFDMVLDGHIHQPQRLNPKFQIGGNPLHRDLGDIGNEKGIWMLDLANPSESLEFISRKGRYPEIIRVASDKVTLEMQRSSFVVPTMDKKATVIEGSADAKEFSATLSPKDLLTNFYKSQNIDDERLLQVGLSLLV